MTRWTEEKLAAHQARRGVDAFQQSIDAKPSKYRNQKVTVGAETFDSKREYQRYCQLKMMEKAGKIYNLTRQLPFTLAPSVTLEGKTKRALQYRPDFCYNMNPGGELVVEDSKGCITDVFRIKQHLMKSVFGIDILLT